VESPEFQSLAGRSTFSYPLPVPNELSLPAFAKINLSLRVVGKREDGFHELCTVFQTVSLADEVHIAEAEELSLTCSDTLIPLDSENIIIKAAHELRRRFDIKSGARIHLVKDIPSPGGLGGGSSNAAVALLGLRRLWRLEIGNDELVSIGKRLGADVPFFFHGGTALGIGRGDIIEPLADIQSLPLLIVTPDVSIPTREAFARVNAPNLTSESSKSILKICRLEAESTDFPQTTFKNDLESSVFESFPEVRRVKQTLLGLGATNAAMSGSGASVFAVFDKEETRQAAINALDNEVNWRKFAVAAISRDQYREALSSVF
jgi:4-diphosphocytidyl-2-C-methyl-D-erythritol kinase